MTISPKAPKVLKVLKVLKGGLGAVDVLRERQKKGEQTRRIKVPTPKTLRVCNATTDAQRRALVEAGKNSPPARHLPQARLAPDR